MHDKCRLCAVAVFLASVAVLAVTPYEPETTIHYMNDYSPGYRLVRPA